MIIITGASGFVGQNLTNYLIEKGEKIKGLSLRNSDWASNMDYKSKAIIHLAGKAHDTSNISNAEEYYKVNRDLTIALFNQFLKSEINDFFYFSSVKAVADSVSDVLDENFSASPKTPYGKSKLEAEFFLLSQELPKGKRLFIIRPCMIHGPGNKGNLNLLYKVVKKGIPWPLASFNNRRSFLSVDNLSYLIKEILDKKKIPSGIYNFSDDESLSTNDLVRLIATCLGKRECLLHIPSSFVNSLAKIGDMFPLPLNSERLKKLTESYVVSNNKVKASLGIEKLPVSAKEGLMKTIRSFQITKK